MYHGITAEKFEAFCWMHLLRHLAHPIKDFHKELISLIEYPRLAVAAPRSFAKSSYFSFFYPLFLALEKPGVQVLLISATGALSETWLSKIRAEIEANRSLISFYGDQVGDRWTTENIQLKNGSVIMAKGQGKQIRGFRPDVIIGDDLETDEMVVSKEQREKFDRWFWTDLFGTLKPSAQLIIIGTILHPESFLADLVNAKKEGWETRFYQAIKKDGSALWPDQWPLKTLELRKKEMGEYAFAQEYMNDPVPDDKRIFQKEWIKYFDKVPEGCIYFTTVDPAIALGENNDFTAIVTCAVDQDANLYVAEIIHKRMLPKETIDKIFDVYRRFEPEVIGIESVGFQKMLKYEAEDQRKKHRLFPRIVELSSEGRRKRLRIEALQPRFQTGTIFIRREQTNLETELLRFPSPRCHDDIIDALAYQLQLIKPARKSAKSTNPNSFQSFWHRIKSGKNQEYWGNHNLRTE